MPRLLRFLLICLALCRISYSANAQFFDSLSRPALWLRPDKGRITTTSWEDVSGHARDAVFAMPPTEIKTNTLNYHKSLQVSSSGGGLMAPVNLESAAEISILAVFQTTDTLERAVWGTANAVNRKIRLTTRQATGPDQLTDAYGKREKTASLNTITQSWDNTAASAAQASFLVGGSSAANADRFFDGTLAELVVFKRGLSFLERAQLETYLAIKYGVGIQGHNYVSSGEKLLWHMERNAAYGNIAGIGRDDAFELYQKQSCSAYDSGFVTMSLGSLATVNASNTKTMNDGDFILWGDNKEELSPQPGAGTDSVLTMTQRRWLVTATGTTVRQLVTDVYMDVSKLPATEDHYWLVIDRSGTGNFSTDNLEYVSLDRTENGKAVYKVTWDIDGSGADGFAFARARSLFAIARTVQHPVCTDETAGKLSIEAITGKAPFSYTLTSTANKIQRSGRITDGSEEENELKAGDYVLTVRDANKDELIRYFTLVMPDVLTIDGGADQSLTPGTEVTLTANGVPDTTEVSYLWQNNFGLSADQPSITVAESGVYQITVTRERDGCAFTDVVLIGGGEEQRLAVYPTVVKINDPFNISVSLPEPGGVEVHMSNSQGLLVQTFTGSNQTEYQFVASLNASGVFVIVIQTPNGIESRKVIIN